MNASLIPGLTLGILLTGIGCPPLEARTWTSADGRTLEADYVSSSETEVRVRRKSDFRLMTLRLSRISEADRNWLAAHAEKPVASDEVAGVELPEPVSILVEEKGTLIFEDHFNREDQEEKDDLGENWTTNSEKRAQGDKQNDLVDGVLQMTISPRADHAISTRTTMEPFKDVVVALRMLLPEGGSLKLAYNDRQFKEVHAGHINGVTIHPQSIRLDDERTGRFNLKYREDRNSPEARRAMKASQKTFPIDLDTDEWHEVVTLHRGETLTVYLNGKEVAAFESAGFGHPTKRDLAFAVPKAASVDDLRIWAIED